MKSAILTISMILMVFAGYSQHLGEAHWQTEEDFRNDEGNILENILWLEENPFATEANDTKAISQYVIDWLTESPYLSVTLDDIFTYRIINNRKYKYADKFKVTYLFGKAAYIIQNPDDSREANAMTRGVIGMINVYEELIKSDLKAYNRTMEYYRDLYRNGRLEEYIQSELELRGVGP